jgi:hypothetical protein
METVFVVWASHVLPSIVTIESASFQHGEPGSQANQALLEPTLVRDGNERLIERQGALLRVNAAPDIAPPFAVKLPLDRFFDIRTAAALRLSRALAGKNPGPNPAMPSKQRRDRLVFALRALDGRLDGATYRDVALALFGAAVDSRPWKTHDLRDRTIRLARHGRDLMQGGYRQLLLYPYRQRR